MYLIYICVYVFIYFFVYLFIKSSIFYICIIFIYVFIFSLSVYECIYIYIYILQMRQLFTEFRGSATALVAVLVPQDSRSSAALLFCSRASCSLALVRVWHLAVWGCKSVGFTASAVVLM